MNSIEQSQALTVNSGNDQNDEELQKNIFYHEYIVHKIGSYLKPQSIASLACCCRATARVLEPKIWSLRDRAICQRGLTETTYHPYGDDHEKNLNHQKSLLDQLGESGSQCFKSIKKTI